MERLVYFVVFKPQEGQKNPAYSYLNKDHLQEAVDQGAIDKAWILPIGTFATPEVTKQFLEQYNSGNPGHLL